MDEKIATWIREVRRYNPRLHLVSRSMEKDLEGQAGDTLGLLEQVNEPEIADLGTGSGFLAVLYKTIHPESRVWMIERSQKKSIFLRHVVDLLGFRDTNLLDADPNEQAVGPFAAVMARSFSPRETLADTVLSIISRPGRFYYFSTGDSPLIDHPLFDLIERSSRECRDYRLNLETYEVTSR